MSPGWKRKEKTWILSKIYTSNFFFLPETAVSGNLDHFISITFPSKWVLILDYLRDSFSEAQNAKQKYLTFEKCWAATTECWKPVAAVQPQQHWKLIPMLTNFRKLHLDTIPDRNTTFCPANLFDKHGQHRVLNVTLPRNKWNEYLTKSLAFLCWIMSKSKTSSQPPEKYSTVSTSQQQNFSSGS